MLCTNQNSLSTQGSSLDHTLAILLDNLHKANLYKAIYSLVYLAILLENLNKAIALCTYNVAILLENLYKAI